MLLSSSSTDAVQVSEGSTSRMSSSPSQNRYNFEISANLISACLSTLLTRPAAPPPMIVGGRGGESKVRILLIDHRCCHIMYWPIRYSKSVFLSDTYHNHIIITARCWATRRPSTSIFRKLLSIRSCPFRPLPLPFNCK